MLQLCTTFGKWKVNSGWDFQVGSSKEGKLVVVEDQIKYEEFLRIVCEDYNLDTKMNAVNIAYMLPKHMLDKLPTDTPHIFLNNDRQLANFITMSKREVIRLCVSLRTTYGGRVKDETCDVKENCDVDFDDVKAEIVNPLPNKISNSAKEHQWSSSFCDISDDNTMKPLPMLKYRTINVGHIFDDTNALITTLGEMSVIIKFDFNIKTSTKKIFVVICFVHNCSWKIRDVNVSASSSEFIVTKFIELHTCSAVLRYTRQQQANVKCIGNIYFDGFSGVRDLKEIMPRDIMNTMQSVYGLDIGYTKAHGALVYARDQVRATPLKGYQDLHVYLYKIELANPGTITKLVRDDNERFKYLFIAFGACVKGFEFLRRVVVVDGTHLTGKYIGYRFGYISYSFWNCRHRE